MIFLSYAKEDTERASRIYSLLSRKDRPVFYDKVSLLPGMNWKIEIEEKLSSCSLFLILCTKNSVTKEGYVNKEIRLALERAENMPDGSIFIIPVRFDNISIPQKLTKYQWINIDAEVDYYDLQFCIDVIWNRLHGLSGREGDHETNIVDNINVAWREKAVVLVQGKNVENQEVYAYVELALRNFQEVQTLLRAKEKFDLRAYGEILEAGLGSPSEEVSQQMTTKYNLSPMTQQQARRSTEEQIIYQQYLIGFTEGFRSIQGNTVDVPLVESPSEIPDGSTPLREGIREGIRRAQSRSVSKQ